jgi:hypothetical protein
MLPGIFVNGSSIRRKRIPFKFFFSCVEIITCGKTLQITPPLAARTLPRLLLRPGASGPLSAFEVGQPMTGGFRGRL